MALLWLRALYSSFIVAIQIQKFNNQLDFIYKHSFIRIKIKTKQISNYAI